MTKVVIANDWVDAEGRTHEGGHPVEVEPGTARDLISRGKARAVATDQKSAVQAKKESK
ncbi:hypothetical protein G7068_08320 [Leucobacter viscericola]|uniref:Uncharacterized protein n=1 Tax=Leucobacter viscericola TaxID=2714935 RepID=A0A6G7XF11_9MICO|nr:hypothetical protein [Leucobacter viscericola]QIK63200.1 hypothetical protein G7068_08320 [Leucobacter viscericola]